MTKPVRLTSPPGNSPRRGECKDNSSISTLKNTIEKRARTVKADGTLFSCSGNCHDDTTPVNKYLYSALHF